MYCVYKIEYKDMYSVGIDACDFPLSIKRLNTEQSAKPEVRIKICVLCGIKRSIKVCVV